MADKIMALDHLCIIDAAVVDRVRRMTHSGKSLAVFASCCLLVSPLFAADPWGPWVEADQPFFSSSLDLRGTTPNAIPWNITPRGIVLNLGHDCWACFDTELLRISAIWFGKGATPDALTQLSYQDKPLKTLTGQSKLPKPDGTIWLMNGVYPGWQTGERVSLEDPREPQPSKEEPGRGPLAAEDGRFKAVRIAGREAVLEYTVASASVEEWMTAESRDGELVVRRNFRVAPCAKMLWLVLAEKLEGPMRFVIEGGTASGIAPGDERALSVRVPAHDVPVEFSIAFSDGPTKPSTTRATMPSAKGPRWPQEVTTTGILSTSKDAYVVDDIPLPLDNPWHRNVRLCDLAFFKDGTAAGVTFDGDVWMIRGLHEVKGLVRWKRFASGLHEPMGLVIRDEQIFVFDRNGIWQLQDANGDGEADRHELFSNAFPQSAESREFPNSIDLAPDGSFVIAKGGQQASTISRLNGSVLRVAPDGQSFTVLGHGFRQPYAGVNPRTGEVTASDQEGHYTPTTPLYFLERDEFHGFLSELLPREKYPEPIADPLTWIPHTVNPSAATQTWLFGAKMGPLNDSLVHVGFNRPELFRMLLNKRFAKPQAAIVSIVRDFDVPALNATVNPRDGFLYVTGFQVNGWGTTAKRLSALARVHYTGATCTLPREIVPMDKGVLLRFDVTLDPQTSVDRANYSLESWHYQRTFNYGSPHLKADGTPGQNWLTPSSAYLSQDGTSVFVGVPEMKPVMQMRIGWALAMKDGATFQESAYFTPHELVKFDSTAEGFGNIEIDLTPKPAIVQTSAPASVEEGRRVYQLMGCMACHATDDSLQPKIGPSWKGLYGKERELAKGATVTADDIYLRESILTPSAKTVKGYERVEAGMPVYAGVLTDSQVESLILFIKSLK